MTKYAYDFYGNLTTYTDGDGNSETYSYNYNDRTGWVTGKITRNNCNYTYQYDNAGNLKIMSSNDSSGNDYRSFIYTYDQSGNITSVTKQDSSDIITYQYDNQNNVTSKSETDHGKTYVSVKSPPHWQDKALPLNQYKLCSSILWGIF